MVVHLTTGEKKRPTYKLILNIEHSSAGTKRRRDIGSNTFATSALEAGRWSAPNPGRFTPEEYAVPILQEAGWSWGPI